MQKNRRSITCLDSTSNPGENPFTEVKRTNSWSTADSELNTVTVGPSTGKPNARTPTVLKMQPKTVHRSRQNAYCSIEKMPRETPLLIWLQTSLGGWSKNAFAVWTMLYNSPSPTFSFPFCQVAAWSGTWVTWRSTNDKWNQTVNHLVVYRFAKSREWHWKSDTYSVSERSFSFVHHPVRAVEGHLLVSLCAAAVHTQVLQKSHKRKPKLFCTR